MGVYHLGKDRCRASRLPFVLVNIMAPKTIRYLLGVASQPSTFTMGSIRTSISKVFDSHNVSSMYLICFESLDEIESNLVISAGTEI